MSRFLGFLVSLGCLVVLTCAVLGAVALHHFDAPGPSTSPVVLVISPGESLVSIGERLRVAGVLNHPRLFALGVLATGGARRLQAGEYAFPGGVSMRSVAAMLAEGETLVRRFTLVEGTTVREAMALLAEAAGLEGPPGPEPPEGSLLPDTYFYRRGDPRSGLVERMRTAMDEAVHAAWASRAPDLPFETPEEALVLASIIERETALDEERSRIAGVFVNRLRRGMRLQADPTVRYGILRENPEAAHRPLSRADLDDPHPWNTYHHSGLPPTPIANPGRASLHAAVRPRPGEDLYFVADGRGGHAFARSLAQHNRNVARLRALEDGSGSAGTGD